MRPARASIDATDFSLHLNKSQLIVARKLPVNPRHPIVENWTVGFCSVLSISFIM
jgi:hypothetical protein